LILIKAKDKSITFRSGLCVSY